MGGGGALPKRWRLTNYYIYCYNRYMETKQCTKCKETKPADQFYRAKYSYEKDGLDYYCKYCRVGTSIKSQRGGNKKPCSVSLCEKVHYAKGMCRNHYTRWYNNGSLDSVHDVVKDTKVYRYAHRTATYKREYMLMYKYKLTLEQFLEMSKNGCQICGNITKHNLNIDHDHACCTGEGATCGKCVRGVVCNRCNMTIGKYENGLMRDDNPLKDKIKEYLNG
jgi:hypothetical protein